MLATITKDYYDGSKSKSKTVNLDGLPMSTLIFELMGAGVAGITITPVVSLEYMIKHTQKSNDNQNQERKP